MELKRQSTLEVDNLYINHFLVPFVIILILSFGVLLVKKFRNNSDKYSVEDFSDDESTIHPTHFLN